eukprot:scaffold117990_cov69-Phaeocystis_antarctica.AAC.1
MHQYRTSIILALALANSVSALLSRPTWRVSANTAATEPAVEPNVPPQPAYEGLVLPYDTGVPGFMKDIVDQGLLKSDPHSLDELQTFVKDGPETQNAADTPGLAPMPRSSRISTRRGSRSAPTSTTSDSA